MMKKYFIISLLCLIAGCGLARAHEIVGAMLVTMTDNAKEYYLLPESPQVTFPGAEIKIVSPYYEASFKRSEVADIRFTTLTLDNLDNTEKATPYTFSYADHVVTVKGSDVKSIELFDVSGGQVALARAHEGVAAMSLGDLPKGVYIVRIPGHTSVKIAI